MDAGQQAAQETLDYMRAERDKLPDDIRHHVENLADQLRKFVKQHGPLGYMALALVGAEYSAEG